MLHVPVIVVAGTPEINDLPEGGWAAVLRRPVSLGEIANRVVAIQNEKAGAGPV